MTNDFKLHPSLLTPPAPKKQARNVSDLRRDFALSALHAPAPGTSEVTQFARLKRNHAVRYQPRPIASSAADFSATASFASEDARSDLSRIRATASFASEDAQSDLSEIEPPSVHQTKHASFNRNSLQAELGVLDEPEITSVPLDKQIKQLRGAVSELRKRKKLSEDCKTTLDYLKRNLKSIAGHLEAERRGSATYRDSVQMRMCVTWTTDCAKDLEQLVSDKRDSHPSITDLASNLRSTLDCLQKKITD